MLIMLKRHTYVLGWIIEIISESYKWIKEFENEMQLMLGLS